MNKEDFLNTDEVNDFIAWAVDHLYKSYGLFHSWVAKSSKAAKEKGASMEFFSINDAYQKYYWSATNPLTGKVMHTFHENEFYLNGLRRNLKNSISSNISSDGIKCYDYCKETLVWGGVWYKPNIAKTIKTMDKSILPKYLKSVLNYLNNIKDDEQSFVFSENKNTYNLEVDSGTTKIYSLLSDEWIIYDGRVAAALGFLVSKWAGEKLFMIPDVLKFSHPNEVRRNPNPPGKNIFPLMKNNKTRLSHNLYANWLIYGILEKSNQIGAGAGVDEKVQARGLEAALFMLGYCIRSNR